MTSDQNSGQSAAYRTRKSRRGVLAGAAGALTAVAVETAARGTPAQAANGDPVLQGTDNGPTTSRTMVFTANNEQFASLCDLGSHGKGSVGSSAMASMPGCTASPTGLACRALPSTTWVF